MSQAKEDEGVGSGSAGSVVASRLSEDPNVTVLLVEAGGDDRYDERILIPGHHGILLDNAWETMVPTSSVRPGREYVPMRSGMILGGSSSVNGGMYVRGSRHDFDRWAEITGDEVWNYEHVLPYFKKSEGVLVDDLITSPYHGKDGPLSVSFNENRWSIYKTITEALHEMGYSHNADYNGESMEGVCYTQYNTAWGERVSCSRAFIHPALGRANLHVSIHSFVQRVLLRNTQAYGIEMVKDSRKHTIKASKEVILSGGAIQSPKILMLSGIGPKAILTKQNIQVIKDLPVGRNLQNHPMTDVSIAVSSPVTGLMTPHSPMLTNLWYKLFKIGWLATSDGEVMLVTSTTTDMKDKDWPNLQIMFFGKPLGSSFMKVFKLDAPMFDELVKFRDAHPYGFGCLPMVLRPGSRGNVTIDSDDPFDLPTIDSNYMDIDEDINLLIQGIRICQRMVTTKAMKSVGASLTDLRPLSVCNDHAFDSDAYWTCYIRKKPMVHYHPVGTCKMGSRDDPSAVLDSRLRVKGIQGLRVVDASVMPMIVSANTHAATTMIGEMASAMIKGDI